MATKSAEPRRRNPDATQSSILRAARICFSDESYDRVSLRQIATMANVDVAMVSRAYGSKEELYKAAISTLFHFPIHFSELTSAKMADALIEWLVVREPDAEYDINLAMIRSACISPAREILRQGMEEHFVSHLAATINQDDAVLRAELLSAVAMGLITLRDIIQSSKLHSASPEQLHRLLSPVLRALIEGARSEQ